MIIKVAPDKTDSTESDNQESVSFKEELLAVVQSDPELPTLGASVARIVQLSSSDDESIRKLSHFVLSDVSLTQKILRLSNSVSFRSSSNKAITSITKAIFLLGFNTVKACALAVLLVDSMAEKQAKHVRYELVCALSASMMGRELAQYSHFNDAEEITVAALFKNIGRLLLAAYFPDRYQETMALVQSGSHSFVEASREMLQFNLDDFAEDILTQWELPASIIQTLKPQPEGVLKEPRTRQKWMQQAVELCDKAVPLVLTPIESRDAELEGKLLTRFGKALHMDKNRFNKMIAAAGKEAKALEIGAELIMSAQKRGAGMGSGNFELDRVNEQELIKELVFNFEEKKGEHKANCHPSGKPFNASELLLTGVQDVIEIMASGKYKLSDLITLVLETFYNSLGFRFVALCLRDREKGQYRARSSVGENFSTYQKGFVFPIGETTDLFHLAMKQNVDLVISDASVSKVRNLLPKWYVELMPDVGSFMVLPLVSKGNRLGLFYADRLQEAPEGISTEEMRLIKTLKTQVLAAMYTR